MVHYTGCALMAYAQTWNAVWQNLVTWVLKGFFHVNGTQCIASTWPIAIIGALLRISITMIAV